jgi:hypothetical protein
MRDAIDTPIDNIEVAVDINSPSKPSKSFEWTT